jgi:hypothetical protein
LRPNLHNIDISCSGKLQLWWVAVPVLLAVTVMLEVTVVVAVVVSLRVMVARFMTKGQWQWW